MKFPDFSRPKLSSFMSPRPFRRFLGHAPQNNSKLGFSTCIGWNEFKTTKFPEFWNSVINSLTFWYIPWLSDVSFKFPDFSRSVITLHLPHFIKYWFRSHTQKWFLRCKTPLWLWHYHSWLLVHILFLNITSFVKTSNKHQCCQLKFSQCIVFIALKPLFCSYLRS